MDYKKKKKKTRKTFWPETFKFDHMTLKKSNDHATETVVRTISSATAHVYNLKVAMIKLQKSEARLQQND